MLTTSQLKALIVDNLNDDKLYGVQLLLTEMLSREMYDVVMPRYRFKRAAADITSLADLIAAINASAITVKASATYFSAAALSTIPVVVTIDEIEVTLNVSYQTDSKLTAQFGTGKSTLGFVMNYTNDGDAALPLKILNVILV